MDFPLAKVLLATDGSKDATLAARAAVDVCEGTGAELYIVHVSGTRSPPPASGPSCGPS